MSSMRRVILAVVLVAWSCTVATAQQELPAGPGNDEAAQEALLVIGKSLDAMAAMDLESIKAALGNDVSGFDIDLEGKPVRMGSRTEAVHYFEEIFAWAKKTGASLKIDRHSTDCHATSTMAVGALEYDFVAVMPDSSTMVQPTRTTVVLRKDDDGWKWAHWHSSLSVLPAPPTTPSTR